MAKWTGPLQAPPPWLDPEREIKAGSSLPPKAEFIATCLDHLRNAGCSWTQAFGVAANTMNEAAWGQRYLANNLGGWKITRTSARDPDGTPRYWARALGNKGSGDPQTCFYRAFRSYEDFFRAWLLAYVPKDASDGHRYRLTGKLFWEEKSWFPALIEAGYKGPVTRARPQGSIREHQLIEHTLRVFAAQRILGVKQDGAWGPKSSAACADWQHANGLLGTGELDAATQLKMFGSQRQAPPSPPAGLLASLTDGDEEDHLQHEMARLAV